jgi:hypothetical protein
VRAVPACAGVGGDERVRKLRQGVPAGTLAADDVALSNRFQALEGLMEHGLGDGE